MLAYACVPLALSLVASPAGRGAFAWLLDQAERYLAGQDFELIRAERDVVTLD